MDYLENRDPGDEDARQASSDEREHRLAAFRYHYPSSIDEMFVIEECPDESMAKLDYWGNGVGLPYRMIQPKYLIG